MIKLSKPHAGWIEIDLGKDRYSASYLTDVPMDLIDGCMVMLTYRLPFILEIDTESNGHFTFVNSRLQRGFLVTDSFDVKEYEYIEPLALADYIYEYLTTNLKEIYEWFYYEDDDEENAKYRKQIDEGLIKLKEAIEKERAVS